MIQRFRKNRPAALLALIGALLILIGLVCAVPTYRTGTDSYEAFWGDTMGVAFSEEYRTFGRFFRAAMSAPLMHDDDGVLFPFLIYGGVLCIAVSLLGAWAMDCDLSVDGEHVRGRAIFQKYVSIPKKQITALSQGTLSSLTVHTAGGRYTFTLLKNREELQKLLQ